MSNLNNLESSIHVRSVSLKYVFEGRENYFLKDKLYALTDNHFVITNRFSECRVLIDKSNDNTGICIDLDEKYFDDIIHSIYYPNDLESVNQNCSFFLSDDMYSQGLAAGGNLKLMLRQFTALSQNGGELVFRDDFLRNIAFELILSQQKIIKEYNNISVIRSSTKKELYSRLINAREIMRESSDYRLTVKEIASMVCLSEFRFHHLFKKTFGQTPMKYQTNELMKKAIQFHSENKYTWTEIADRLGYADLQTFSKVFKRTFGCSPLYYR